MSRPNRRRRDEETGGVVGLPVLEHGVHRMKQLDGDNDQRLLGRFALGLLAEINGAPLATTAHGIHGGEVERMARNARADARQAGSRCAVATLVDDRVKADICDERPRIGEACERSMAWSNVRDGGEPSPSILDECSRPGGRGATFSVDGCSRRSAEVPVNQSSFPSYLRTDFTRTLLLPTRGTATTLASTLRS